MMRFLFFAYFLFLSLKEVKSQNRLQDNNSIGWLAMFNTIKWSSKWSSHLEFQYRRADFVKHAQQNLYRFGINYDALPNAQIRFGFATVTTFPYGDYPINTFGKTFGENRFFEMIALHQKLYSLQMTHRLMLEQRWIRKFSAPSVEKADDVSYSNRFRYMFKAQLPVGARKEKKSYLAAFDELFVSFGKNVGENVFDQNRTGFLVGRSFNNVFKLEGGYFCQILQLSREIESKNVIQYNQGFIINSYFNFNKSGLKPKKI